MKAKINIIAERRIYAIMTKGHFLEGNFGSGRFIYDDKDKAETAVDAINRTDPVGWECNVKEIDLRVVLSNVDICISSDINKKLEEQIYHLDIWGNNPDE